ncbi:hypothetical protein FHS18_006495 [Paenibacillus phyllosphaerae]|uniref:Uncharacterized protein n=1 Tax=Paenibacillus phyllosphaerae TaxID=274593 RepID=A0A7W5FRU5_9BACL|nr:ABC-2 transporter permease [Paenibacillus phyllosphaerae]MBB3114374.1 hypothetical protein [Paenibacillus phyllosphaerae]
MRTLMLQVQLELRLLAKLRLLLLLPPAAGLWLLFQCADVGLPASMDVNLYAAEAHEQLMTYLTVLPIFLGVWLIRHDTMSSSYEWSLSLPVSNRTMIASKWIAGFLISTLFTICILAAYILVAFRHHVSWTSILTEVAHYGLLYELSFAPAVALGIVLGALMPFRFALPIAFCGWVFGSIFVPVYLIEVFGWYPMKAFSLNQLIGGLNADLTEAWSYRPRTAETLLSMLFTAAFTLCMLSATGAMLAKSRPVLRPAVPVASFILSLLLAGAAFTPYLDLWTNRYEQFDRLAAASVNSEQARPHDRYRFKLDRLDIHAARLADNSLELQAELVLPTDGGALIPAAPGVSEVTPYSEGRITFLLNPLFRIERLAVDGQSVNWTQENDHLSFDAGALRTNTDKHTVSLTYTSGGPLQQWSHDGSGEYYQLFVAGDSVFLPSYAGWYPIPGGDHLLYRSGGLQVRSDVASLFHADFSLTMEGFGEEMIATIPPSAENASSAIQRFEQRDAEAPSIISGAFTTVRIEGEPLSIVTTPGNVVESRIFLAKLHEKRVFYEQWAGASFSGLRQIIYFPLAGSFDRGYSMTGTFAVGDTLFIGETKHSNLDSYRLDQVVNWMLFGDTVNYQYWVNEWDDQNQDMLRTYSIVQELRRAISYYLPLKEAQVDTDDLQFDFNTASPLGTRMKQMIDGAYAEGDGELVKRVLLRFWKQGLHIEDYNAGRRYVYMGDSPMYLFPVITWDEWLQAWDEEKGRLIDNDR